MASGDGGAPSMFAQRLNPLTGAVEWVVVDESAAKQEGEKDPTGSVALSSYLDMLNDVERNSAFKKALQRMVQPGDLILDIGTGTGLLSMLVAEALQEKERQVPASHSAPSGRVVACESFPPMVRMARQVISANGLSGRVRVLPKRSDDLQVGAGCDLPERADLLVTEILDSELLGEGVLPTLRHAWEHLLKPGARAVPHSATVYAQLVECDYLQQCHQGRVPNADMSLPGAATCPGQRPPAWALHVDAFGSDLKQLSAPFRVFVFDFTDPPEPTGRQVALDVRLTSSGRADALVTWWQLRLDPEGSIVYSTAPDWAFALPAGSSQHVPGGKNPRGWHNHWRQCVWPLTGGGVPLAAGQHLRMTAQHDDLGIWYSADISCKPLADISKAQPPQCRCGLHSVYGPERVGMLGDDRWQKTIQTAVKNAVAGKASPTCLVVDDSLVAVTVSNAVKDLEGARVFASPPSKLMQMRQLIADVSTASGLLPHQQPVVLTGRATSADLKGVIDVLLAEPFYIAAAVGVPWHHLRFWHERAALAPLLAEDVTMMPCKAVLRGVAVSCPDLWESRRGLSRVEGFDHSAANELLGACGEPPGGAAVDETRGGLSTDLTWGPMLPCATWQAGSGYKELTAQFDLLEFDFQQPIQALEAQVQVPVLEAGVWHGVVLWMDWLLDQEQNLVLSTGPRPGNKPGLHRQGVKLLKKPQLVCSLILDEVPVGPQSQGSRDVARFSDGRLQGTVESVGETMQSSKKGTNLSVTLTFEPQDATVTLAAFCS